jgi:hypothetical protein
VLWGHDTGAPIAYCVELERFHDRVEAVAQFPPKGVSALADEIFRQIGDGTVAGASIGAAWLREDAVSKAGVLAVREYEIREFVRS